MAFGRLLGSMFYYEIIGEKNQPTDYYYYYYYYELCQPFLAIIKLLLHNLIRNSFLKFKPSNFVPPGVYLTITALLVMLHTAILIFVE